MERKHPATGFTLIEVLLAVSVFAIVLAAINTVFFGALRLRNKTIESFDKSLPIQQALSIIQKDCEGILPPGGKFAGAFTTTIEDNRISSMIVGERVTPDIHTSAGPVNPTGRWSDVIKVAYFLTAPSNQVSGATGGKDLVRLVTRNLLPVGVEELEAQFLMGGVDEMRMLYFDGRTWLENWDSSTSTNLPRAIQVQITLLEDRTGTTKVTDPIELIIPVLLESSTNSTEEAAGTET